MSDDLISRQAAIDKLKAIINREYTIITDEAKERAARNFFADIPSSDAVEVVRCKDCKYRQKEWHHDKRNKNGGYWISWCDNDAIAERVYGLAQDNDFCSYGER